MATDDFQTIARVGDIPEGQGRCFPAGDTMIGLFHDQGQYFALSDFCPHMGASLSDGHVEDGAVLCPWHAWRFRLSDGLWLDNSRSGIRTPTFDVRIEGDAIQVRIPTTTASAEEPAETEGSTPNPSCSPDHPPSDSGCLSDNPPSDGETASS